MPCTPLAVNNILDVLATTFPGNAVMTAGNIVAGETEAAAAVAVAVLLLPPSPPLTELHEEPPKYFLRRERLRKENRNFIAPEMWSVGGDPPLPPSMGVSAEHDSEALRRWRKKTAWMSF